MGLTILNDYRLQMRLHEITSMITIMMILNLNGINIMIYNDPAHSFDPFISIYGIYTKGKRRQAVGLYRPIRPSDWTFPSVDDLALSETRTPTNHHKSSYS